MIRNANTNNLNVIAVFLVDIAQQLTTANLPLDAHPDSLKDYRQLAEGNNLSSPAVFSNEGGPIKLVTK